MSVQQVTCLVFVYPEKAAFLKGLVMPQHHFRTIVIGAGAVGASVAYELSKGKSDVLVVDEGAGLGNGCSYANAGVLSPSHIAPLTTPENLMTGIRELANPNGPFRIEPRLSMIPWLLRFGLASTPRRSQRMRELMQTLGDESLQIHREYRNEGLETGITDSGSLDVYFNSNEFKQKRQELNNTSSSIILDSVSGRDFGLNPISGAVHNPDDAFIDSMEYMRALINGAESNGVSFKWGVKVERLRPHRLGVLIEGLRHSFTAENVILASGMGSQRIAASCGLKFPLKAGVGYVADFPPVASLTQPVMFKEHKIVATPFRDRLRISGTMDLGASRRPKAARVEALLRTAKKGVVGLPDGGPSEVWVGERPCTADGVPIIGRSRQVPEIVAATGHGMWGIVLGPITGRLVAQDVDHFIRQRCHSRSQEALDAFSPDRF